LHTLTIAPPRGSINNRPYGLSGNAIAVKGMEPCCPILRAESLLLLAPGNGHAHMASQDTPWGWHTCVAWATWLSSWSLLVTTSAAYDALAWSVRQLVETNTWADTCSVWHALTRFSWLTPRGGQKSCLQRSCLQRARSPASEGQKFWPRGSEWMASGVGPPKCLPLLVQKLPLPCLASFGRASSHSHWV
jgi:hypothetical protein